MSSALLVMDVQTEIVAMLGERAAPIVERIAQVIAAARVAKRPVIYIVVGWRPGYPELDRGSPMYERVASTGRLQTTTPGSDIAPQVAPLPGDVVIQKHRVGAFPGTDLDMICRSQKIDTLILTGFATSGVVLSTVRAAFDLDYRVQVVADCCADRDDEVHRVLLTKVFPGQAKVVTATDAIAALA